MNDIEKLERTIEKLLDKNKFWEIYLIMYVYKAFFWWNDFINFNPKNVSNIFKILDKNDGFKKDFSYQISRERYCQKLFNSKDLAVLFSKIREISDEAKYKELYIYLLKKGFLKQCRQKKLKYCLNYRIPIELYLNKNIFFKFLFWNFDSFKKEKGTFLINSKEKKAFLSENIFNSQNYIKKVSIKSYLYTKFNHNTDIWSISLTTGNIIHRIKNIFSTKMILNNYKNYVFLHGWNKIYFFKKELLNSNFRNKIKSLIEQSDS